jgi:hypothetical protein
VKVTGMTRLLGAAALSIVLTGAAAAITEERVVAINGAYQSGITLTASAAADVTASPSSPAIQPLPT